MKLPLTPPPFHALFEAAITQGDAAQLQALIAQASQARSAWQLGKPATSAGESQED